MEQYKDSIDELNKQKIYRGIEIKKLLENNKIDKKESEILKKYIDESYKFVSARNQILEWKKAKVFFEDKLDYSSKESFVKSFETLREEYYKSRGNYISYSEIIYLLGNKSEEFEKIGILITEDNLGENLQYVKLFSSGDYRATYENIINKDELKAYIINPKLMSDDYNFLLKKEKNTIEKLLIEIQGIKLKDFNIIKNGKTINIQGDVSKILGIKNGSVMVSSKARDVLGKLRGGMLLKEIILDNFNINKEEKIRTELRNTELNVMVIEDYDTKELVVKTFILDRMADALDFNLTNTKYTKNDEYDLDNANKFEIVVLLDEKKFENRKQFDEYVKKIKIKKYNPEIYMDFEK